MNFKTVEKIANAVLYEGYMLYPYRPSAVKNRKRWNFGVIYPKAYSLAGGGIDPSAMQTECLVLGNRHTALNLKIRFLHLVAREVGELINPLPGLPDDPEPEFRVVDPLRVGEKVFQSWEEAVEREVTFWNVPIGDLEIQPQRGEFAFAPLREREIKPIRSLGGEAVGVMIQRQEPVHGTVEVAASEVEDGLFKITLRVENRTPFGESGETDREESLMSSFVSAHALLGVRGGEFVSLLDPPERFRDIAASCSNVGTWPVMVGDEQERNIMLSSPIILYDYPQIAPESRGDLFDATEIDEILTLRIMTLTDEEKREIRESDERARSVLDAVETLPADHLWKLHGAVRHLRPLANEPVEPTKLVDGWWNTLEGKPRLDRISIGGVELKPGDRVRLRPRQGGTDIFDAVLKGKVAIVESIEQDYEDRVYIAVTVDDDPGRELGIERMPAHRFFFSPEEIEPLGGEGRNP